MGCGALLLLLGIGALLYLFLFPAEISVLAVPSTP